MEIFAKEFLTICILIVSGCVTVVSVLLAIKVIKKSIEDIFY